jgi:hypothetical protein
VRLSAKLGRLGPSFKSVFKNVAVEKSFIATGILPKLLIEDMSGAVC